jgi:malate/lactate dehydrogenase
MKIGIIGAGNIGATLAKLLTKAGHEVAISNSRGPETLRDVVAELGDRAQASTADHWATSTGGGESSRPASPSLPLPRSRAACPVTSMN